MRLYQFVIPTLTNAGLSYERQRKEWASLALDTCDGLSELPMQEGQWKSAEGRIFRDRNIPYQVAADARQFDVLLAAAFKLFPDQLAIFTVRMGDATIHERPTET